MLDEKVLTDELARLSESFAVPTDGAATILARRDQGKVVGEGRRRRRWRNPVVLLPVLAAAIVAVVIASTLVVTRAHRSDVNAASLRPFSLPQLAAGTAPRGGPTPSPATDGVTDTDTQFGAGIPLTADTAASPSGAGATRAAAVADSAKIVKTGSLTLVVPKTKFSTAFNQLTTIATGAGGYVASSGTSEDSGSPSGRLTLRVPVAAFEATVSKVRGLGRVTAVSTQGQDVTADSVDLDARISSLTAARQQYLTLMSKATTVGDVLAVQQQVNDLQTQIEQLQGKKRLLDSQTSMSTLDISLGDRQVAGPAKPASGLRKAWHRAVDGFVGAVEGLLGASGVILFVLLAFAAAWIGLRPLWRRVRRWAL
ncbi:MAG: hypothetical protein QOG03_128 [Actinomycetota bacterium]|nr:hypothetical protein [Actinomycetota bacterium]